MEEARVHCCGAFEVRHQRRNIRCVDEVDSCDSAGDIDFDVRCHSGDGGVIHEGDLHFVLMYADVGRGCSADRKLVSCFVHCDECRRRGRGERLQHGWTLPEILELELVASW